jgi:uncharacterized protein
MPKKYTIVDAQFHHIPPEAGKKVAESKYDTPDGKGLQARVKDASHKGPYERIFGIVGSLEYMEECGVDMVLAGLSTWAVGGLEVCKAINDGMAKAARKFPGKVIPLAHVPCIEGQAAVDELDRAITKLGLKGVTVVTSQRDITLDDPSLKPFFKKVSELRVPVVVHPTIKAPIWGGARHNMSGSVSREYEISKSFVEVLCGVLPEFPDIDFLFAHYGGGIPFLLGRIMSWYSPQNAGIPPQKMSLPKTIREFEDFGLKKGFNKLLDRMYFNMAGTGGWMPAVKQALLVFKPERLCFATDYPFEMERSEDLKAYINGIKRLDIPEEDKANIFGGNIRRLFKA